ncbi:MAG: hypothetical protein QOK29_4325 [Rhodospirillaceae bacterium]|jgi:hypothetical protein|nr:hypothetical protein [Rhodospirillaceae bacterium]
MGELDKAIGYYKTCKRLFPEALTARAELVKLNQIQGNLRDRDQERAGLLALHRNSKKAETRAIDHYTRDIFAVGARSIVAWEYFELSGEWPSRYRFFVLGSDDKTLYTLALSSSAQANAKAATLLGHKTKLRVFHLDTEETDTITTLKVFEGEPSYDAVKPLVVDAIRQRERSKTTP